MHSSCAVCADDEGFGGSVGIALLSIASMTIGILALCAVFGVAVYYAPLLLRRNAAATDNGNAAQMLPLDNMGVYTVPMREDRGDE